MSSFAATPATESGAGPRRHPTRWWAAQWLMLALTAAVLLALFELTDIDRQLTQVFYDPAARAFPLRQHWFFDAVLHRGAKQASYLLVVACLWLCWRGWRGELSWLPPRNALLAALGMLLIPLTTTLLKHATNRYCPWDIVDFGGFAPYSGLLHALPPGLRPGQCFPAGHSGRRGPAPAPPGARQGGLINPEKIASSDLFSLGMGIKHAHTRPAGLRRRPGRAVGERGNGSSPARRWPQVRVVEQVLRAG
jgi:hypothetical protein